MPVKKKPAPVKRKSSAAKSVPAKSAKITEPIIPKEKPRITAGFIALIIFFGVTGIFTLIAFFTNTAGQPGMFLGFEYNSFAGLLINIASLVLAAILIYGIFRRVSWTRDVALIYHALLILNGIVSLVLYFTEKQRILNFIMTHIPAETLKQVQDRGITMDQLSASLSINFLIMSIVVIIVSFAIFMFYYKKKEYFTE